MLKNFIIWYQENQFIFFYLSKHKMIKLAEEETGSMPALPRMDPREYGFPRLFGHAEECHCTLLFSSSLSPFPSSSLYHPLDLVVTPPSSKWKGRVRHYSPRLQFRRRETGGGRMYGVQLIVK